MPFNPAKAMECARKFQVSLASCYSMECTKEQLIESCEAGEQPVYIDCRLLLECTDLEVRQIRTSTYLCSYLTKEV